MANKFSGFGLNLHYKIRKMKKLLIALLLPLSTLAQSGKEFKIKGSLKTTRPVDWVYLRYGSGDQAVLDSLQPKNGEYKFEGQVNEPLLATLNLKYVQQPGETRPKRENYQVYLEASKIEINTKDSLELTTVSGSKAHTEYMELGKIEKPYKDKLRAMDLAYTEANKKGDKAEMEKIIVEYDALENEMKEKIYPEYVKKNPASPIALYAVKQYAGFDIDPAK